MIHASSVSVERKTNMCCVDIPVVGPPDDVHPAEGGEGAALDEEDHARPHHVPDLGHAPELEGVTSFAFTTMRGIGLADLLSLPLGPPLRRSREVHLAALVVGCSDLQDVNKTNHGLSNNLTAFIYYVHKNFETFKCLSPLSAVVTDIRINHGKA